ncbi:MAG: T9SS type A sorting domain-containing protein, partial [Bacteroidota bacterium]
FEKVGQMAASGRLNGDQYVYDLGTLRGLRYYRLKLVDEDGSIHYSAIVTVRTPCANIVKDLKAYPNPLVTTAVLNLELQASPQAIEAWISDQLGRVLYRFEWDLEEGLNRRSIDLQGLPDGIYFLHTLDHKALKFIKQTQSRP